MEHAKKIFSIFRKCVFGDDLPPEEIEQKFGVSMSDEEEHFTVPGGKMPIGRIVFGAWITLNIRDFMNEEHWDTISAMLYENRLGEWYESKLRSLPRGANSGYGNCLIDNDLFRNIKWDPIFEIGDRVETRNMTSADFRVSRKGVIVTDMDPVSRRFGVRIPKLEGDEKEGKRGKVFLIKAEKLTRKLPIEPVE